MSLTDARKTCYVVSSKLFEMTWRDHANQCCAYVPLMPFLGQASLTGAWMLPHTQLLFAPLKGTPCSPKTTSDAIRDAYLLEI